MSILLTSSTADDYDLATGDIVLTHIMAAAGDVRLNLWVGTSAIPCEGTAGVWELETYVRRSGAGIYHYMEPFPQEMLASTAQQKLFVSKVFDVNAGDTVLVKLKSPNAGDDEVSVYTELVHVTGALPAVVPAAVGGLAVLDANGLINVDVERLAGVVQSLTDLKHFADSGYNPATGSVVLVDTTTTNTDMPTAAANADAVWDEALADHDSEGSTGAALDTVTTTKNIIQNFKSFMTRDDT